MKKRMILTGLFVVVLCVGFLVGCGSGNSDAKESAVITLSGLTATYDKTVKAAVAEVKPQVTGTVTIEYKKNGVRVEAPIDAGEYEVTATLNDEHFEASPAKGTLVIAPKSLSLSGCVTEKKVYDGTSTVSFSANGTLSGVIEGDTVTLVRIMATAVDKNVGEDKAVRFSRCILGGTAKDNYTVTLPQDVTVDIQPKQVTIGGVTIDVKHADGSTSATFTGTPIVVGGIGADEIGISVTKFEFMDAHSGRDKKLRVTARLTGADRENYFLIDDECGVTGIIGIVSGDFLLAAVGTNAYAVLAYMGSDAAITLPGAYLGKPITEIANEAFKEDTLITSVTVPASYKRIGEFAFAGSKLKTITFGADSTLENIGFSAFTGSAITAVEIPATLSTISGDAFKDCALADLRFADRDTAASSRLIIGDRAFYGTKLRDVTIPGYVSSMGFGCFQECKSLKTAVFEQSKYDISFINAPDGKAWTFAWSTVESITFNGGVSEIPKTFAQETPLTTLVLSEGIEKIGFCAFIFTHITELEIPSTVKRIEEGAFKAVAELKTLTFASGGTVPLVIEEFVFYQTSIATVVLPARVSYLGWGTFAQMSKLSAVTIEQGDGSIPLIIGDDAFDLNPLLTTVALPQRLTAFADNAFDSECIVTGGNGKAKDHKDPVLGVPRD